MSVWSIQFTISPALFWLTAAYTTFFILGLVLSMQVPFVGFQPVRTSEHMAAHGKHCAICSGRGFNSCLTSGNDQASRLMVQPMWSLRADPIVLFPNGNCSSCLCWYGACCSSGCRWYLTDIFLIQAILKQVSLARLLLGTFLFLLSLRNCFVWSKKDISCLILGSVWFLETLEPGNLDHHFASILTITLSVHFFLSSVIGLWVVLAGVFVLLQAYMFLITIRDRMSWETFKDVFIGLMVIAGGLVFMAIVFLTWAGKLLFHFSSPRFALQRREHTFLHQTSLHSL